MRSWSERTGLRAAPADVRALLAFRSSGLTPAARRRARLVGLAGLLLTLGVVGVAAWWPGDAAGGGNLLALLPTSLAVFLALAAFTAVAAGGGRELLPREEAVAFPVTPAVDHLGALLLAPLNVAWWLQVWVLLGSTAYVLGPTRLPAYVLPVLLWVVLATAVGQVVGWAVEGVRRGPHGTVLFRGGLLLLLLGAVAVVATDTQARVLDALPTDVVLDAVLLGAGGSWLRWGGYVAGLGALVFLAVVLGVAPAAWALSRPMRAELGAEGGQHGARPTPRSDLAMVRRVDRASVWRSVPLRRGAAVLGVTPGLVAIAGDLPWELASVMPGLVAAGGALLFGVNAWCLDARGALWRESLPVAPGVVFWARALVLGELLLGSALVTVLLVAVRAGVPSAREGLAVGCCTLAVVVQVVSACLRWSDARPAAVDLRSARATPAPPVVMVGYSARLALVTTTTGLAFSALAVVGAPWVTLWLTCTMLTWSLWRLERTARRWRDPVRRARVVATVSG